MPKAKSATAVKSKSKSRNQMRDIKPKVARKETFTIRQLQAEEVPTVEPLLEDIRGGEVQIHKIEQAPEYTPSKPARMNVSPLSEIEDEEPMDEPVESELPEPDIEQLVPKETIKVKFGKFVQLVANHDFDEVIEAHAEDEIIMSSNLLTELAGAHDKREERKIPLVFLVGIVIGVVLTYIFFNQ